MRRYLPFIIIGAVLIIALGVGAVMYRSAQPQPTATPAISPTPNNSQVAGVRRGRVTIEEYGDYQCPPCGTIHPEMKKLKNEFGDRVNLVFYNFPLTKIHRHALDAAHAAVAAGLQGKFWEMHDLMYGSQKEWSELPSFYPVATSFAKRLHLDVNRFQRDMDSAQVAALVSADVQRGESRGVRGTPTLFIEGELVSDEDTAAERLRQIIIRRLAGS